MKFTFQKKSKASKLGAISSSYGHPSTCPDACPLKNSGCFAESGFHTRQAWKNTANNAIAVSLDELSDRLKALPVGHRYRYAVAGDLPGIGDNIDAQGVSLLADSVRHLQAWTYTHKPLDGRGNLQAVHDAIARGFSVNISCETQEQVDRAVSLGLPAVMVGESSWTDPRKAPRRTTGGNSLVVCPASIDGSNVTCETCGGSKGAICSRSDRDFSVIFPAHGIGVKHAEKARLGQRTETGFRKLLAVIQ